jgi:hypothetical protein
MRQSGSAARSAICALLLLGFCPAFAETPPHRAGVTIDDFSYVDTSGEVTDQSADHQRRLRAFMAALRKDVAADGGAGIRVIGGIRKASTLVQWAKVAVIDVGANRVLFDRLYTFRGDNDVAWDRARAFISEDVRAVLAASAPASAAAAPAPIEIAVFDFELEDMSAAGSPNGIAATDAAHLAEASGGVRELLAQSGRYHLVDVGKANADAATKHALRDCNGCDAGMARRLRADQSLIGVVRRVSRTEYTVGFQLRDARSGAVIARGDSGLRMGADYSWARGAVRLVRDRLLESQPPQ